MSRIERTKPSTWPKQLQHVDRVNPLYVKQLLDAKLEALGYKDSRPDYALSTYLEKIYNECIGLVRALNVLMEAPAEDVDELGSAVADVLWVGLDSMRYYAHCSKPALRELGERIAELDDEEEERQRQGGE